jgi:hypothetical protein
VAFPSDRSEPVTIYALSPGQESRRLDAFDALPEPGVAEIEASLVAGETIRPDASRLFRSRPGWQGNPLATRDGSPGVAYCWMEVEGPLHDQWPPAEYRSLFGELPSRVSDQGEVEVDSADPNADARRLLARFLGRAYRRSVAEGEVEPSWGSSSGRGNWVGTSPMP